MTPRQLSVRFHCECERERAIRLKRADKPRPGRAAYAARRVVELRAARAMFVERVG